MVQLAPRVLPVLPVAMEQLAPKALSVPLDPPVTMEQLDPRVLLVPPVTMAQSAPRVLLVLSVLPVAMEQLAPKALSVPPDLSDPLVLPVTMAQLALKVQQALKVRFPMVLKLAKCTIGMGMLGFIYLLV